MSEIRMLLIFLGVILFMMGTVKFIVIMIRLKKLEKEISQIKMVMVNIESYTKEEIAEIFDFGGEE